ncbi:MAG: hypothetical protein OEV64_11205, partial [Desulfobulbaceae bacterium]|nr:hypothetical protein [Desulfobulbaceae bacterium]
MNKSFLIIGGFILTLIVAAATFTAGGQIKFVFLGTDILIYVLVLAVSIFVIRARHQEHLRAPWRHVSQRPLAMASAVVLSLYVAIGLLDSIHFRQALENQAGQTEIHFSGEVLSIFDLMVTRLRSQQEKTYSA